MIYRFGEHELDVDRYRLVRDGEQVPIEPRVLDLLVYLIGQRDRLVAREELLAEVWKGQAVVEGALSQAVHAARAALGETSQRPRHIQTVHGRGYRFTGEVEILGAAIGTPAASPASTSQAPTRRHGRRAGIAFGSLAGLLLLAATTWFLIRDGADPADGSTGSLALLPLVNATGDDSLQWVELGLPDLIARRLQATDAIDLIPVSEVATTIRSLETAEGAETAGEGLAHATGARWLVTAVLTHENDRYRLRATLSGAEATPRTEVFSGSDVFALSQALTLKIFAWLGSPAREGGATPEPRFVDDPIAEKLFAQGMHEQLTGRPSEAARFFEMALAQEPDFGAAAYELAIAARKIGDHERAEHLGEEVLRRSRAEGDRRLEAKAHNHLGILQWSRGDLAVARSHLEASQRLHHELEDRRGNAANLINLGILAAGRSEWDEARTLYEQALAIYRQLANRQGEAAAYNSLGVLAWSRGDVTGSGLMHERALVIRRQIGDRQNESASLNNLGTVAHALGRLSEAETLFGQALALRRDLTDRAGISSTLANLAGVDVDRGLLSSAEARAGEALALARELGLESHEAQALGVLATAAIASEDWARADEHSRAALELRRTRGNRALTAQELGRQSRIALGRGEIAQAAARVEEAWSEAAELDSAYHRALLHAAEARVLVASGEREKGFRAYATAADEARLAGNPAALARIVFDACDALLEQGAVGEAGQRITTVGGDWATNWRAQWIRARLAFEAARYPDAVSLADGARVAAGELWRPEHEALLAAYRQAAARGARVALPGEPPSSGP